MRIYHTSPSRHPLLQKAIIVLAVLAPALLILEYLLHSFGLLGPLSLFALNTSTPLWLNLVQIFTYPFVFGHPGEEIDLYWLMRLSFVLYMLWVIGGSILERKGKRTLFSLYGFGGVGAGAIALLFAKVVTIPFFYSGSLPVLLSLLLFWTMLSPELTIWIFSLFPVRAKWAAVFLIVFSLLGATSAPAFLLLCTSLIATWLYALVAHKLRLPFQATQEFENTVGQFFSRFFQGSSTKEKIISFRTLQNELQNEEFLDKMEKKIAKEGEGSLTLYERWKMARIFRKKRKITSK